MEKNAVIRTFIENNLISLDEDLMLSDTDNIFELGYVNSLFAMKLLNYVQKTFNIELTNDDIDMINFSSIVRIVALIESKQNMVSNS